MRFSHTLPALSAVSPDSNSNSGGRRPAVAGSSSSVGARCAAARTPEPRLHGLRSSSYLSGPRPWAGSRASACRRQAARLPADVKAAVAVTPAVPIAALVQAANQQEAELARVERENDGILRAELAATRIRALFAPLVELIELAGMLLVLGWGTWSLSQGTLSLGGLLAFLAFLGLLYRPVRDLGHVGTGVFEASAAAERVLELLDREPLIVEQPGARSLGRARGKIARRIPAKEDRPGPHRRDQADGLSARARLRRLSSS